MAKLTCPKCGNLCTDDGWAKAAMTVLSQAPAVPDMATQVRCPQCQHIFAEVTHSPPSSKVSHTVVLLACLTAVIGRFISCIRSGARLA